MPKVNEFELKLLDAIRVILREHFPNVHNLIVSFDTENEVVTLVNAPCPLCVIENARTNIVRNGSFHRNCDVTLARVIDEIADFLVNDEGEPTLELLKRFNSKVKN